LETIVSHGAVCFHCRYTWASFGETARPIFGKKALFRDPFVTEVFSKQERFHQIMFSLHVTRIDGEITDLERRSAIFSKIRPLLTELNLPFLLRFSFTNLLLLMNRQFLSKIAVIK
jgi:hypothetical protein